MEELIRHFDTVQKQMQAIQVELEETKVKQETEKQQFKKRLIKEFNHKLNKCKQDIRELKQENERLRVELEARRGLDGELEDSRSLDGELGLRDDNKVKLSRKKSTLDTKKDPGGAFLGGNGEYGESEAKKGELVTTSGNFDGIKSELDAENDIKTTNSVKMVLKMGLGKLGKANEWPKVDWVKPATPRKILTYKGQPVTKLTSSQVNDMPTQYSSDVSPDSVERPKYMSLSPLKKKLKVGDIVEDSEEEFEPINIPLADISDQINNKPPQTKLQRKEFLRKYYKLKFQDPAFKIDLATNPITETIWILEDFTHNTKYRKPVVNNKKAAIMTKQQQDNLQLFHELAGNSEITSQDLTYSQIFDKFPTPPGFLNSEFPDTQEQMRRRKIADDRRDDRIQRRLASALLHYYSPDKQGEFVFVEPILNQYVDHGRFLE